MTDPAEVKVRQRKQRSMLSTTLKSQMASTKERHELIASAEKERDIQFVSEVAEANRQDQVEVKRMNEENKKICREFWHEQMMLHKKHRKLMEFL